VLTLTGRQRFIHLGFQHLLQHLFDDHFQQISLFRQRLSQFFCCDSSLRAIVRSGQLFLSSAAN